METNMTAALDVGLMLATTAALVMLVCLVVA
jgi:hypothetical protein